MNKGFACKTDIPSVAALFGRKVVHSRHHKLLLAMLAVKVTDVKEAWPAHTVMVECTQLTGSQHKWIGVAGWMGYMQPDYKAVGSCCSSGSPCCRIADCTETGTVRTAAGYRSTGRGANSPADSDVGTRTAQDRMQTFGREELKRAVP